MTEPSVKRTKLNLSGHSIEEQLGQSSNNQVSSMASSPAADISSVADHQDSTHASSFNSAHLVASDNDIPLNTSMFARISANPSDCACARTNIIYIAPKPKPSVEVNCCIVCDYCCKAFLIFVSSSICIHIFQCLNTVSMHQCIHAIDSLSCVFSLSVVLKWPNTVISMYACHHHYSCINRLCFLHSFNFVPTVMQKHG